MLFGGGSAQFDEASDEIEDDLEDDMIEVPGSQGVSTLISLHLCS